MATEHDVLTCPRGVRTRGVLFTHIIRNHRSCQRSGHTALAMSRQDELLSSRRACRAEGNRPSRSALCTMIEGHWPASSSSQLHLSQSSDQFCTPGSRQCWPAMCILLDGGLHDRKPIAMQNFVAFGDSSWKLAARIIASAASLPLRRWNSRHAPSRPLLRSPPPMVGALRGDVCLACLPGCRRLAAAPGRCRLAAAPGSGASAPTLRCYVSRPTPRSSGPRSRRRRFAPKGRLERATCRGFVRTAQPCGGMGL